MISAAIEMRLTCHIVDRNRSSWTLRLIKRRTVPGQRMVKNVHDANKKLPIFIGGLAFSDKTNVKFEGKLITGTNALEQIPRIIRKK